MTARPLHGVQMLNDAARRTQTAAVPAIAFVVLDGLPRTGLTVREVAKITGHAENRIRTEIRNGRLRADGDGQSYVIPVSALADIEQWADYQGPRT